MFSLNAMLNETEFYHRTTKPVKVIKERDSKQIMMPDFKILLHGS